MSRRRGKRRPATLATDMPTPTVPTGPAAAVLGLDGPASAPAVPPAPAEPPRTRGAQVLDEARAFYAHHFHFPTAAQLDAFTLWCAGVTHLRGPDHTYVGSTAPRLLIRASTSSAGKTLLADLGEQTCGRGEVVFSPGVTELGVVQMISEENKTVWLDNYDETKGQRRDGQLTVLLAGAYRKSSTLRSGRKDAPTSFVYGPVAVTAIGDKLRQRADFRPVVQRSVVIDIAQKPEHVHVQRFDDRDPDTAARVRAIQASCAKWGRESAPDVATYRPADLPALIADGRTLAMWEPLVGVADHAGGPWPERARRAVRVLVRGETVEDDADADPFATLTAAERTMVSVSHVLTAALDAAQLDALGTGVPVPDSVSLPTVALLAGMAELPGGDRWAVPEGTDRDRMLRARTMALSTDLGMFGVTRSSVKVPAGDGRYVNGWYSSDVLPHRPEHLPHYSAERLDAHARQADEDDVPFE